MGNPTNYMGATMSWYARQMQSYSKNGTSISYTYDADGLRGSKTVNSAKTTYQYVDGQLLYEDRDGTDIYYYYDSYGTPTAIRYHKADGTAYTFYLATNQLGDVIGIYNASGNMVVKYEYDAWGRIISTTDANGGALNSLSQEWSDINPFRYRGYYYDSETELYYLQSRYYDAEVGRFLNADAVTDGSSGLLGNNLFIYAANNPINYSDPTGYGIIKNFIKLFVDKVVKPIVNTFKKVLKKTVKGTRMVGVTGTAAYGAQYTKSRSIAYDGKGNIGYVKAKGPGGGTPSASIGCFKTVTNAPTIEHLKGYSFQMGGSVDVYGVSIGLEPTFFNDSNTSDLYGGITCSASLSVPIPVEIHADYTYTDVYSVNIFDLFDQVYNKVMEW